MIELADAWIGLPSGIGTMEEFMEVWTLNQLSAIDKPSGLFSVDGYFAPFMGFIDHMIKEAFLPAAHRNSIVVESDAKALLDGLINFEKVTVPKWMFNYAMHALTNSLILSRIARFLLIFVYEL